MKKFNLTLVAAVLATVSSVSAFTMDFVADLSSLSQGVIPEEGVILNVAGYGELRFTTINLPQYGTLEVGDKYGETGIQFDAPEELRIEFLGSTPTDFAISYETIGLESDEFFYQDAGDAQFRSFIIKYTEEVGSNGEYTGDGAAITRLTFNAAPAIPEPSLSFLGLVGMAGLLIRRNR